MIVVHDVEVFPNFFSYAAININTREKFFYYLHEDVNQLVELLSHLNQLKGMIGFNSLNYDSKIIHSINKNTTNSQIYKLSKSIINNEKTKWIKQRIPQLDLFKVWHFDNRTRRTSLKDVEMALRWWNLQSLPLSPEYLVTKDDIPKLKDYNFNDVESTLDFYLLTKGLLDNPLYKGVDKIDLRNTIYKQYKFDATNMSDVKIGDEINKVVYCNLTGIDKKSLWNLKEYNPFPIQIKDCIPPFIKFTTPTFEKFLEWLQSKEIHSTKGEIKRTIGYANIKLEYAQGGIHSKDEPGIIEPLEDELLLDYDVGSQYPATILNQGLYPRRLGIEWLKGYEQTFNKRLDAKAKKKDPYYKNIADSLKLALNGGGYGKTGESYNWQYDPLITSKVTTSCQLGIMMLIEQYHINGFRIISANTDGVTIICNKNDYVKVLEINKEWEDITGYILEESNYKKIVRTSVNDYLAVFNNGYIKFKGDFEIDKEIHKNHSQRIVGIALANYFINNTSVENTITNHLNTEEYKFHNITIKSYGIFDFCMYVKATKEQYYTLQILDDMMYNTKRLLKNNRYIITKNGGELIKNYSSGKEERVNVGYLVSLANIITEDSIFDINYEYYINECNKIIKDKVEYVEVKRPSKRIVSRNNKKVNSTQLKLF